MVEMHQHMPSVNMAYYINTKTIETIHSALEIPSEEGVGRQRRGVSGGEDSEDDSVREDVEDKY